MINIMEYNKNRCYIIHAALVIKRTSARNIIPVGLEFLSSISQIPGYLGKGRNFKENSTFKLSTIQFILITNPSTIFSY